MNKVDWSYIVVKMLWWTFLGEIQTDLSQFGYMWECPDYFELDGHDVILFPQGVEAEGEKYRNIYQSGYMIEFSY